jgi:CBS domain-containing protein
MNAADVMTVKPVTVRPDSPVADAVALMLQHKISGLPVVDVDDHLVGIVTEGDFLRRAETATERKRPRWLEFIISPGRLADEYVHSHGQKVSEVMTQEVASVSEDTPLQEIVLLMERRRIKRVLVVRGSKLVGIVSRANLLQALAGLPQLSSHGATDDVAIRGRLLQELERQPWLPRATINVIVQNGVVHLWGCIFDERERDAMRVAAENLSGVKSVVDHLVWVEPVSGWYLGSLPDLGTSSDRPEQ